MTIHLIGMSSASLTGFVRVISTVGDRALLSSKAPGDRGFKLMLSWSVSITCEQTVSSTWIRRRSDLYITTVYALVDCLCPGPSTPPIFSYAAQMPGLDCLDVVRKLPH